MSFHEKYMQRCFELALRSQNEVQLNPNVGAVIVYKDTIIGEGYHQRYGSNHAEVNAINSVSDANRQYLKESTIYVSLEPCNHQGKTPPCTQAILQNHIPHVVVSCMDPNPLMRGKSISLLRSQGVRVDTGLLEKEGNEVIKIYQTTAKGRPYIILKFAQSADNYLGQKDKQVWLSNAYSKVIVHKWRSQIDGILIGVNTGNIDNPKLTTREYPGNSPLRIILDPHGKLNEDLHILKDGNPTLIFTKLATDDHRYVTLPESQYTIQNILDVLYQRKVYRLMVEGGKSTLQEFIKENLWDEARVIRTPQRLSYGMSAPTIMGNLVKTYSLDSDQIDIIQNIKN